LSYLEPNLQTPDLWCTAEMCTANIVVCLPALKALVISSTPVNTLVNSNSGYIRHKGPGMFSGSKISGGDDEIELVSSEVRMSPSTTRSPSENRSMRLNDIRVTTGIAVETYDV
jgi:hypothetical protein